MRQRSVPSQVVASQRPLRVFGGTGRVPPAFTNDAMASFVQRQQQDRGAAVAVDVQVDRAPLRAGRRAQQGDHAAGVARLRAGVADRRVDLGQERPRGPARAPVAVPAARCFSVLARRVRSRPPGPRPVGRKDHEQQDRAEDHRHGQRVDDVARLAAKPGGRAQLDARRRRQCSSRCPAPAGTEAGSGSARRARGGLRSAASGVARPHRRRRPGARPRRRPGARPSRR